MLLQDDLSERYAASTLSGSNVAHSMTLPRSPQDTPSVSFSTTQCSFVLRKLDLNYMRGLSVTQGSSRRLSLP